MKTDTIARTIITAIALLNSVLVMTGKAPLDLDENTVYTACSMIATVITTVWAWWKNNSFTKEAIKADEMLKGMKNNG